MSTAHCLAFWGGRAKGSWLRFALQRSTSAAQTPVAARVADILCRWPSRSGAVSDACVSGGIDWLNRDFRAMAGKGSESVDTRIEFRLIKVMPTLRL